jgi:predicted DNA-binding ribbon-helix-helix protein
MCELFIGANPERWQTTSRSMRFDGMVSSIRLENMFWEILEEIGARDQMPVNKLINRLYYEAIEAGHDLANFTSFLRVCCLRYLNLQLTGQIPTDGRVQIASLPARQILAAEASQARSSTPGSNNRSSQT